MFRNSYMAPECQSFWGYPLIEYQLAEDKNFIYILTDPCIKWKINQEQNFIAKKIFCKRGIVLGYEPKVHLGEMEVVIFIVKFLPRFPFLSIMQMRDARLFNPIGWCKQQLTGWPPAVVWAGSASESTCQFVVLPRAQNTCVTSSQYMATQLHFVAASVSLTEFILFSGIAEAHLVLSYFQIGR